MITKATAFYLWNATYGERMMLWTYRRMIQKSRIEWNRSLAKGDYYGYFQTTYSFSTN